MADETRTNHGSRVPAVSIRPGRRSDHPCEKCGKHEVFVERDSDGGDYTIHCYACGMHYRAEGPD